MKILLGLCALVFSFAVAWQAAADQYVRGYTRERTGELGDARSQAEAALAALRGGLARNAMDHRPRLCPLGNAEGQGKQTTG